jgi:hypothetical protein
MAAVAWRTTGHVTREIADARRAIGWRSIVFMTTFVLAAGSHTRHLITDSYVALFSGRLVAHQGIPILDPLTVAGSGRTWIDQQWLGQLLLYRTWLVGGYAGLALVSALLYAAALTLLFHLLLARGASTRRALKWTALGFCGSLIDLTARPQDFAYPLFMVVLVMLLCVTGREPVRRRWMVGVLALLVLWANLHGSVLLGVVMVTGHCLLRGLRSTEFASRWWYLATAAMAPLTVMVTPYGYLTIDYYRSVLGNGAIRDFSTEWQPATPTSLAAIGYLAVVAAVLFVVVRCWRRGVRPSLELALIALAFGVAGISAIRWGSWASFVGVVLATDLLNRAEPTTAARVRVPRLVAAPVILAVVALVAAFANASQSRFMDHAPLGAMTAASRYAAGHPGTRILADDLSSSALLWLYPQLDGRVALDGRLEIYRQSDVRQWVAYIRARPGSMALTRGYQIFVASASNVPLCHALRALPQTRTIYSGPDGIVVIRT